MFIHWLLCWALSCRELSIMEREGERSHVAAILLPIFVHNPKGSGSI
ncbi:hypothetical protein AMTRI_Chr02g219000 [Amborella trichopoda]